MVTKISSIFYLNDDQVLDSTFADYIKRCYPHLLNSNVMIRQGKEPKYWSSVCMEMGLAKINGFLPLDELLIIAEKTTWSSYKIWEAVDDGFLTYLKHSTLAPSQPLSEAIA